LYWAQKVLQDLSILSKKKKVLPQLSFGVGQAYADTVTGLLTVKLELSPVFHEIYFFR